MMKKLMITVAALVGLASVPARSATMCASDTLANYLLLGSDGCVVGTAQFSGFSLSAVSTGAIEVDPAQVTVDPINSPFNTGLLFSLNLNSPANVLRELFLTYAVTAPQLFGSTLQMTGSSATGDGADTAIGDLCLGGDLLPICSGTQQTFILFDIGTDSDSMEHLEFAPVPRVGVGLDIAVDGGTQGTASLGTVSAQFNTVPIAAIPEPATGFLISAGIAAILWRRRRRRS